jgi:hypothetical protein
LKKALTVNPIDAIFVVVEFSKPENIIELFEITTHPLEKKNYLRKVILIISKYDQCEY